MAPLDGRRVNLLGGARKSLALVNRHSSDPVASWRYFDQCLPEVQESDCRRTAGDTWRITC